MNKIRVRTFRPDIFRRLKGLLGRSRPADTVHGSAQQDHHQEPDSPQDIYNAIIENLWSIMPEGARKVELLSKKYEGVETQKLLWIDEDNVRQFFEASQNLSIAEDAVEALLEELKRKAALANSPWNQASITLSSTGKFEADFANIHRDDMHLSLHMKGISDLTAEAAVAVYIDRDDWVQCSKAAVERKSAEACQANEVGDQALADRLRGQVNAIEERLAVNAVATKLANAKYEDGQLMRYYYLCDDIFSRKVVPGRWHLGRLRYMENYELLTPTVEFMEPGFWHLEVYQDGVETDFSLNGPSGLPIISKKVKEALSDIWEIEKPYQHTVIEPIILTNKETDNEYFIMITEDAVDCIDEDQSDFERYVENDPVRPDLAGEYSVFLSLVIDPERVKGRNIFRIKNRESILIVSEEVKKRFEAVGATGASFGSVNGDCRTIA